MRNTRKSHLCVLLSRAKRLKHTISIEFTIFRQAKKNVFSLFILYFDHINKILLALNKWSKSTHFELLFSVSVK